MPMELKLSPELFIDLTSAPFKTEGFQIFVGGKTGAGKSYTLSVVLEEAHRAGIPFVYLDPHGEGYTLSELGDDVVIISNRVGIPVHVDAIPVYLDILKAGKSMVFDLSALYFENERLFAEFSEEFIRKFRAEWASIRSYILLCIDEIHVFAPQKPMRGETDRVKMFGKMASEGRKLGIMLCTATQRPALVDKTAISQANVRLVGKLEKSHDFNAYADDVPKDERGKKQISFRDTKGLSSGTFYAIVGDNVLKTKIRKRMTTDAGATPDAVPFLSTKQQLDMKDIAKRITEALKQADEERDKTKEMEARIKTLEKSIDGHKDDKKELRRKLDTVEFIAGKFGGVKAGERVEIPQEVADIKVEFDNEIDNLKKRMQRELKAKDAELAKMRGLVLQATEIQNKFIEVRDTFRNLFGLGMSLPATSLLENDTALLDQIVDKVLARVATIREVYEVAPLEALSKDWDRRALERMLSILDGLPSKAMTVLSYLIATSISHRKTNMCEKLFGVSSGSTYTSFKDSTKHLESIGLTKEDGHGIRSSLSSFIDFHMEGHSGDTEGIHQHLVEYIRRRINEGTLD